MKVIAVLLLAIFGLAVADLSLLEPTAPALKYTNGIGNIANKYGDFSSPLSFSSGSLGVLNLTVTGNFFLPPPLGGTNFGLVVPEILALLNDVALPSLVYTESGFNNGNAYFISVSGVQQVAAGLFQLGLLAPKLYSQRTQLSNQNIDLGLGQVNVTFVASAVGLVAADSCQAVSTCFPKSLTDPNLVGFQQYGSVTFQLVIQQGKYKIAQINNVGGLTYKPVPFSARSVSFGPW